MEGVSHMVGGRAASWLSTVLEPECHRVPWLEDDVISLCLVGSHEELRTMKGMERLEEHGRWDPLRPARGAESLVTVNSRKCVIKYPSKSEELVTTVPCVLWVLSRTC